MYKSGLKVRLTTVLLLALVLSFSGGCMKKDEITQDDLGKEPLQAVSNNANTAHSSSLTPGQADEPRDLVVDNARSIANTANTQKSVDQTATDVTEHLEVGPFSGKHLTNFALKRPVMVMVENSPAARPQAGLEDASIVYEFLAEGGITRFLALYYERFPERVGPVRSTRPYFIDIALEYNALLLHAGASTEGYAQLAATKIAHFDQIKSGSYYWRDSARRAPHNLYTGAQKLANYFKKSQPRIVSASRFPFEAVSLIDSAETANAQDIAVKYWGNYTVRYLFDSNKGNYLRFIAGAPHVMEGGKKLYVDNIFIQYVDTKVKDAEGRLGMELVGRGTALLFKDGYVFNGSWEKKAGEQTRFLDRKGNTLEVNPGQTWIQVVPIGTKVDYK